MYKAHYGLQELPFTLTPDTSFFFAHASHQESLNTLLVAIRSGEGFMKVIGEVGTGKTLLCRKFLSALDHNDYVTAYIPNPYLQPMTLLCAIADELGIQYPQHINQHQLLKLLTKYLIETYSKGRRVVLCMDEAQAIPAVTLESLRLLTNLETERRKLLQVVLFGQPELDARLDQPSIRQLKQRISFSCVLMPFNLSEVEFYLSHRLGIAGYRGPRLFAHDAVKRMYKASRGIPRLVNVLAHKSMMVAFGEGVHRIKEKHVRLAIADTESTRKVNSIGARVLRYIASLVATLVITAGVLMWGRWM